MTPLYDTVSQLYQLMSEQAKMNDVDELVFTGRIVKLYDQTGTNARYYSMVRQLLLSPALDPCIEIRQRGNTYQDSIVILRHPPYEDWEKITPTALTPPVGAATLRELEQRTAALENWRESSFREVNILELLRDFERRLSLLEGERD